MITSEADDAPIAVDLMPDWRVRLGALAERLELEIGSGHGGFALAFACARPDRALVAIEQRKSFAEKLRARAEVRGLKNLLALHGDARLLAPRLFRAGSLSAIHVHFPDPWWKRRQRRRRLVDDRMSRLFVGLLSPGGFLDLRTDVESYALEALERLEEAGLVRETERGSPPAEEIPSTREKRYLATGQKVWRLRLRRP